MKKQQAGTPEGDYNVREVAQALGISYDDLRRSGQVDKLLRTGVTEALHVRIQSREINGTPLVFETEARLSLGIDKQGQRAVLPILKNATLTLDTYRDMVLSPEQQAQLREGRTIVLKDPKNDREFLARVDERLNRIAGWKKSAFLVPQKLGSAAVGYTTLEEAQQVALKRGEAVELTIGGKAYRAQVDPADRELRLSPSTKQELEQKMSVSPPSPAAPQRRATVRKLP